LQKCTIELIAPVIFAKAWTLTKKEEKALLIFERKIFRRIYGLKQWRTQEFCSGGGVSSNSVENRGQRERGSGGGSPLVRGSGGSGNLVQEISFHIVKFS
jgi:hypothetical protein